MVCEGLSALPDATLKSLLRFPTSCNYYFWAIILLTIWIVLVFVIYNHERERIPKADIFSSFGVASIVVIVLAYIGTLIGFIEQTIMLYTLVLGIVFIVIWFLKD